MAHKFPYTETILDQLFIDQKTGKLFEYAVPVTDPRGAGVAASVATIGYDAGTGKYWIKVDTGNTDWEEMLVSVNGEFVANLKLEDVAGTIPSIGSLGRSGYSPFIGDGATDIGLQIMLAKNAPKQNADGVVYLSFDGTADDLITSVVAGGAATGICYRRMGGDTTYLSGVTQNNTIPLAHNTGEPVGYEIWPATSATSGVVGTIVTLSHNADLHTVSIVGTAVNNLNISSSGLKFLDMRECTVVNFFRVNSTDLSYLDITGHNITNFFIGSTPNLEYIVGLDNHPTIVAMTGNTAGLKRLVVPTSLQTMELDASNLEYLSVGTNTSTLYEIKVEGSSNLTTVDLSGNTSLQTIRIRDCNIDTVIADGWKGVVYSSSADYAINARNNNLSTDALYDWMDGAVAAAGAVWIYLSGNPCISGGALVDGTDPAKTAAATEALASAKNYTLVYTA